MTPYILRRLLLIFPTLLGILLVNFVIIQSAPGGPVEQMIAKIKGVDVSATARFDGSGGDLQDQTSTMPDLGTQDLAGKYAGARGLDPEFIKELEKMYGFDKPAHIRFLMMLKNYLSFDFGTSYFKEQSVLTLITSRLPVSISLGLWATLIIYLISIPLGIRKALKDGTTFDVWTSGIIIVGYAIPGFLFAILLILIFAGGTYFDFFPLRGLISENWQELSLWGQIKDYIWHMTLPIISLVIGGFATLTLLTKNSFVEEIHKQYVITARAKGVSERKILYGHIFRNAMLVVIGGIPAALAGILFTGALLIEVIFSLEGLGLLGFEAAIGRDYPVLFGTLYIFTLINLITHLIADLTYVWVDPRIDFGKR